MAFHPYPQVIRVIFNLQRFGPPLGFTQASTCSWIDHPASGLIRSTQRPIQTRFRYGSTSRLNLALQINSLAHYAKGTRSHQKGAPTACRHTVSGSIALPSLGFFSPFPHGTGPLSVAREYLALEDGPPRFKRDFTCPALLRYPPRHFRFRIRDCHSLWWAFPDPSAIYSWIDSGGPTTPHSMLHGLGSSAFARRYSQNLS